MSFARETCDRCHGKGLLKVQYHSGELWDLAICDCRAGAWWKKAGRRYIRQQMRLQKEQRVALSRDYDDTPEQTPAQQDAAYHKGLMR